MWGKSEAKIYGKNNKEHKIILNIIKLQKQYYWTQGSQNNVKY
jgi:hypothetical protein